VYRQFFRVQCTVQYPGRRPRQGAPKKVIICWPGQPQPGLKPTTTTPGRPGMDKPVWVSCSCNYFRYMCEWALLRHSSSDRIYSNGQPARSTNPRGIGTLCKHLYVALPLSISSWDGKEPEEQAVEEVSVEEVPQTPVVTTPKSVATPVKSITPAVEEEPEEENIRGASYTRSSSGLYVPSRLAFMAHSLRSIALPFDSECC
jgi:hypothetical protein